MLLRERASLASGRRQRGLVSVVQLLALSCWFSASAVAPSIVTAFGLSDGVTVLLTSSVQMGFVVGAVISAALNLADRFDPNRVVAAGALTAGALTALLAVVPGHAGTVVVMRMLTGMALACVYPVNMKIMASWAPKQSRGTSFGILIGALTIGSAVPQLFRGIDGLPWQGVMLAAAALTLVGSTISLVLLRVGPQVSATSAKLSARYALTMFTQRGPRLANLGYFGHMWELYALWTWLPSFVIASQTAAHREVSGSISLVAFTAIGLAGFAGCLLGGKAADRFGRSRAAVMALVVSGGACVLSPFFFGRPLVVLVPFLVVWGAGVIADSGVFSTALSETADPRYVGTALTTQTAIGFLLTIVTIHIVPVIAAHTSWQWAFLVLSLGPLAGGIAMARFGRQATSAASASTPG